MMTAYANNRALSDYPIRTIATSFPEGEDIGNEVSSASQLPIYFVLALFRDISDTSIVTFILVFFVLTQDSKLECLLI